MHHVHTVSVCRLRCVIVLRKLFLVALLCSVINAPQSVRLRAALCKLFGVIPSAAFVSLGNADDRGGGMN